jgi:hypothetical protein
MCFEELDDLLPSFGSLLMPDVIAQEFPAFGMTLFGVHLLQLRVDEIQSFDWRQLVLESGKPEMCARGDQRVDLRCREVLEQARNEVVDAMR